MKADNFTSFYNASIPGLDCRADWLLGPGLADYLSNPAALIPFVMLVREPQDARLVRGLIGQRLYVPSWYLQDDGAPLPGRYFTAYAGRDFFDDLAKGATSELKQLQVAEKRMLLCSPVTSVQPRIDTGVLGEPAIELPPWDDQTVVIGVIDFGIAIGHERFTNDVGGTRIQFHWRQADPHDSITVPTGRELKKSEIDALRAARSAGGALDEEGFYRDAGLLDFAASPTRHQPLGWRSAHGTHVLDAATGAPPSDDVTDRPIIAVELPAEEVEDTTGAGWQDRVMDGIAYILLRAKQICADRSQLKVVINLSFGNLAGPHDGTGVLEHYFDQRIAAEAADGNILRIVLPSGNSNLSRCHAAFPFKKGGNKIEDLPWQVQPDDRSPTLMQIWMPHESELPPGADRLKVKLTAPDGTATAPLGEPLPGPGAYRQILDDAGNAVCLLTYGFERWPTFRGRYCIAMSPTARLGPGRVAPPGRWTVTLENLLLDETKPAQAWIERDEPIYGFPRVARQSYFDHPDYRRFRGRQFWDNPPAGPDPSGTPQTQPMDDDAGNPAPGPVQRGQTINAIATGSETVVIGGVLRRELRPAPYSAGGPVTAPARGGPPLQANGPDALCVSDDSWAHRGVVAAGSRSGSAVALSGTSVAAPLVARAIADHLAGGGAGDRARVGTLAEVGIPPGAPAPPTPTRGGAGRILRPDPHLRVPR